MSCPCGLLGTALYPTQYHWVWISRSLIINPGAYHQVIKPNESLPTSRLHVGEAWLLLYGRTTEAQHQSYQLGRGTTSLFSLLAFPIALKWGSISGPQSTSPLWGGNIKTPVCSWSTTHLPNIVPPSYLLRPELDTGVMTTHTPNPILECPSFFVSHLIVQSGKKTKQNTCLEAAS